jgi:uncharacterized repeat protein (TIGR02543 family)
MGKMIKICMLFLLAVFGCSDLEFKEKDVYLYNSYAITFNANGGNVKINGYSSNSEGIAKPAGTQITLPTPTRSGYTFSAWYSSSTGGTYYGRGGDPYTVIGNVVMYAMWVQGNVQTYTINFNANGGTVSPSSMSPISGTQIILPTPVRNGYIFDGWFSSISGGTKYGNAGDSYTVTGSLTMFAQWTAVPAGSYVITFNANGGTVATPYTIGTSGSAITLPTPVRSGYTFNGWFSAAAGGTKYGNAGANYTVTGHVTMYAQWTQLVTYTVTFNANSGYFYDEIYGSTTYSLTESGYSGKEITLPTPTRSGYQFSGWYTGSFSGGVVTFGTKVGDAGDSYTITSTITLYARWVQVFTIAFMNGAGGYNPASKSGISGTEITLPTPVNPSVDPNYLNSNEFDGWYSSSSGGTKIGNAGDPYTITSSLTMYAQYVALYTVTFNPQNGAVATASEKGRAGKVIELPTPTRDGYTFNGWFSAASGGTKYESPYTIASTLTMYARWGVIDTESGKDTTINGIACVLVKAGSFTMGVDDYFNYTTHQVTLTQDFWISKYPITQSQYQTVMGNNPSYFSGNANNPVENVTWNNANAFAQAVGGSLPTEAQWEFAARGGNKSKGYIYSGSNTIGDVAWYSGNNSPNGTKPVGQKAPNELGIYDMSGNVWEWCSDWYSEYSSGAVVDPIGPSSGSSKILRGGYWSIDEQRCRVANRGGNNPSGSNLYLGFRVAFPRN